MIHLPILWDTMEHSRMKAATYMCTCGFSNTTNIKHVHEAELKTFKSNGGSPDETVSFDEP